MTIGAARRSLARCTTARLAQFRERAESPDVGRPRRPSGAGRTAASWPRSRWGRGRLPRPAVPRPAVPGDRRRSTGWTAAERARGCALRNRAGAWRAGTGAVADSIPSCSTARCRCRCLWARLQWDVTLLPAEIGATCASTRRRPGEPVRHELRIRPESKPPLCHADHWFFGADGRPLATLTGCRRGRLAGAEPAGGAPADGRFE